MKAMKKRHYGRAMNESVVFFPNSMNGNGVIRFGYLVTFLWYTDPTLYKTDS